VSSYVGAFAWAMSWLAWGRNGCRNPQAVGQEGTPPWLRRSAWGWCPRWIFPLVTETCRG